MIRNAVKESLDGQVVIFTEENIKMMKEMAMGKWSGLMEVNMLDNGLKGYSMVMEKWYFLMALLKKVTLTIIFLLELFLINKWKCKNLKEVKSLPHQRSME
jgi:hypothetical protein